MLHWLSAMHHGQGRKPFSLYMNKLEYRFIKLNIITTPVAKQVASSAVILTGLSILLEYKQ
jgi:hypothetical protein